MPRKKEPETPVEKKTKTKGGAVSQAAESGDTEITQQVFQIPPPVTHILEVKIVGDAPLIMHAWSEKSKREMADRQQGKSAKKKDPKKPTEEMRGACYFDGQGRHCVPVKAFKSAMVESISFCKKSRDLTKVRVRGSVFVIGELTPITQKDGKPAAPTMREDIVRVGSGLNKVPDLRYRPEYADWGCTLKIKFFPHLISPNDILMLLNTAGQHIGVGERRPQKEGALYGLFHTLEGNLACG